MASKRHFDAKQQHAFTLIELLVVVGIIMALMAVAIPALKLSMENRRVSEASRILNAQFVVGRSRAAEIGRPVGVWIERNPNDPDQAISLFIAEVPPPYTGDFTGARAYVGLDKGPDGVWGTASGGPSFDGDDDGNGTPNDLSERGWPGSDDTLCPNCAYFDAASATLPYLVQLGDRIRFNYRGPDYEITSFDSTTSRMTFSSLYGDPNVPLPNTRGGALPFQIIRRPVRSSADAVELPRTTTIDLNLSGFGITGLQFRSDLNNDGSSDALVTNPVVIMFSPGGGIDRVFYDHFNATTTTYYYAGERPTGTVHLMVGQDDESELGNLQNDANLWISVGHSSGSVTSSENVAATTVTEARKLAQLAQTKGGA